MLVWNSDYSPAIFQLKLSVATLPNCSQHSSVYYTRPCVGEIWHKAIPRLTERLGFGKATESSLWKLGVEKSCQPHSTVQERKVLKSYQLTLQKRKGSPSNHHFAGALAVKLFNCRDVREFSRRFWHEAFCWSTNVGTWTSPPVGRRMIIDQISRVFLHLKPTHFTNAMGVAAKFLVGLWMH